MLAVTYGKGIRPNCPFRSVTDRKCYADFERVKDEGLVEQDYEPLSQIIRRFQRGEIVPTKPTYYESDEVEGFGFDDGNPTDSPDFDLVDGVQIVTLLRDKQGRFVSPNQGKEEAGNPALPKEDSPKGEADSPVSAVKETASPAVKE